MKYHYLIGKYGIINIAQFPTISEEKSFKFEIIIEININEALM